MNSHGKNIVANLVLRFEQLLAVVIWRGTVTGTSGNLVFVQRPDQALPDTQPYPRLASYLTPTPGDEVVVIRVGRGFFVLGQVLR